MDSVDGVSITGGWLINQRHRRAEIPREFPGIRQIVQLLGEGGSFRLRREGVASAARYLPDTARSRS